MTADSHLIGGDLTIAYSLETTNALANAKDLIGVILRIHFCLEDFLNVWCNKTTGCEDFFDFGKSDRCTYGMKVSIAEKLGLPCELAAVFKQLNSIRNKFSHNTNTTISDQDINDIRHAVDRITTYGKDQLPKMNDPIWVSTVGERYISWNMPNVSSIDRLILIYMAFRIKAINVYGKKLGEKGIPFCFSKP